MRRAAAAATVVAVLGAGCTGDRPRSGPPASEGTPQAAPKPRCEAMPGRVPEGFVLVRSRDIKARDYVATRKDFRDDRDRLLVYLLGVVGEVGEGAPVADSVLLRDGTEARLIGGETNWALVWESAFPCKQLSVIGNGFRKTEFVEVMGDAALLPLGGRPPGDGIQIIREWVAVFDVAEDPGDLVPGTDELMEAAGGAIAVSPASCWSGLAVRLGAEPGDYVAAVVAQARSELESLTARVGRRPLVTGEFQAHCVD